MERRTGFGRAVVPEVKKMTDGGFCECGVAEIGSRGGVRERGFEWR